jgi:methionyl-tRNA synthetase
MSKFYISTAILYTNGPPHIGFAFELLEADVLARYHRLIGDDTYFLTGTDEHGTTVVRGAEKHNKSVDKFVDEMAGLAQELTKVLNISNDDFIRTTDKERHWPGAIKFWNKLVEAGDLYKHKYKGLYCVGHESFIKKSDLINGLCPLHKTEPEEIEEENWFFRLTKYKKEIKNKIESGELKIIPESRIMEITNLIDDAEDISFSRSINSLKWGIPVPNDPDQVMYVWADALTNYISALGYAVNDAKFNRFWPADVHLIGKDIFRFHALYWPAMLMSAGLPLPKSINVHGFISVDGEKMSKTTGNVIDPFEVVKKYGSTSSPQAGVDVVRYFLLREIPSSEDGDFSYKKLEERYNGDLANGLGNLVQRTITLIDNNLDGELIYKPDLLEKEVKDRADELFKEYIKNLDSFLLHETLGRVWDLVAFANKYIDNEKPWIAVKADPRDFLKIMNNTVFIIYNIAWMLVPFMPKTADRIFSSLGANRDAETLENYKFRIIKGESLFPRLK